MKKVLKLEFADKYEMEKYVIAQDDDCDYEESGYVAVVKDGVAGITSYSHCSCYGTWSAIGNGTNWSWIGTVKQLKGLAKRKGCITIPSREADPNDHDYDHLMEVYKQINEWKPEKKVKK